MLVKMLTNTHYKGAKTKGKEYDIDSVIAQRWIGNGIAEAVNKIINADNKEIDEIFPEILEDIDVEGQEQEDEQVDLERCSPKKLYALCKEKGLEVEPKQTKDYYIERLIDQ